MDCCSSLFFRHLRCCRTEFVFADTMSSSKKILRSDLPMKAIQALRMEIFGETPFLTPNNRSSARLLKKTHTGPYLARYYPETIDSAARKVRFCHLDSDVRACVALAD